MAEVGAAFGGGKPRETRAEQGPERLDGPTSSGPDDRFQLRKAQFNRVEVRTVRGQIPQGGARGVDQPLDAVDVMGGEVVGDDDVAGLERGDEDLVDVGEKAVAVHGAIDDARRGEARDPQARDKGARLPARHRRVVTDADPARAAAIAPQQIRRDARFIEEDQACRVQRRRGPLPLFAGRGDVGPIVFGRAHRFF